MKKRPPDRTALRKVRASSVARASAASARPIARIDERTPIRYPSLTAGSMEALCALLDDALHAVSRPGVLGAVGLAMLASGCQDPPDAPPAATLAPLGASADTSPRGTPSTLTLPGTGGWGSLAAGGGAGTPTHGTEPDAGSTPCAAADPSADVDAGLDAGRHMTPRHDTPHLRGRMPITRPIRTAGVPARVGPDFDL